MRTTPGAALAVTSIDIEAHLKTRIAAARRRDHLSRRLNLRQARPLFYSVFRQMIWKNAPP